MLNHQIIKKDKIALVFIHGYCEDLSMWKDFSGTFDEHTILKVDLPGFGLSPTYDDMTISNMAIEVLRVMQHVKIGKAILIGHSMGGYVALEMSKLMGESLKGLCMFHSHPFEDLPETKEKRDKAITFVENHGSAALMEKLIPTFFAPALKPKYEDQIKLMIEEASKLAPRAVNNAMQAMRDKPSQQVLVEDLACPYHCILGSEDIPTPYDFCIPQINLAKISKITLLEGIGHMGMFTAKQKTQAEVKDFIDYCLIRDAEN